MSPIGETKKNKAFTLIEILLVVIIIGVVMALAAPNFSKGYTQFQLNKTVDDLSSMSRWAQAMAIGKGRIYAVSFSDDRRSYKLVRAKIDDTTTQQDVFESVGGSLGKLHMIPDAIQLAPDADRIDFHPDGTIDPVKIQLISPTQRVTLSSTEVRGMLTKVNDE